MSIVLESPTQVAPSEATAPATDIPDLPIWRLTVEQYHQMLEAGILRHGEKIELLEGWLVPKMTKKPPGVSSLELLEDLIRELLPTGWCVRTQNPVTTGDSEPEPDLSVLRGVRRDFTKRHPAPNEVGFVVEVAETSLREDRGIMLRIYARAKIVEYWIVNLVENYIEVYTEPSGPARKPQYRQRRDYRAGESVPVQIDGKVVGEVPVSEVLP
jgi:Uma2 family endonuclease